MGEAAWKLGPPQCLLADQGAKRQCPGPMHLSGGVPQSALDALVSELHSASRLSSRAVSDTEAGYQSRPEATYANPAGNFLSANPRANDMDDPAK
jgi:hypothetical protein